MGDPGLTVSHVFNQKSEYFNDYGSLAALNVTLFVSLQDCDVMTYMRETCGCCGERMSPIKHSFCACVFLNILTLFLSFPLRLREALRSSGHCICN